MKYAVTGHRPSGLGLPKGVNPYSSAVSTELRNIAVGFFSTRVDANQHVVLTGMALGWDQAVAEACYIIGIPFVACVPFKGQESIWPIGAQRKYTTLLSSALDVVIVSGPEVDRVEAMMLRNRYMVDNAHTLVALWNGTWRGGTANTIKYAKSKRVPIINLYTEWEKF